MAKKKKKKATAHSRAKPAQPAVSPAAEQGAHTDTLVKFADRYGLLVLCALILIYVAVYGFMSWKKYDTFSYYDFDLAIFNQVESSLA